MKRKKRFYAILFLLISIGIAALNYYVALNTKATTKVYVLTKDAFSGTKIEDNMLMAKEVGKYNLDADIITDKKEIAGKFLIQTTKKGRLLYKDMVAENNSKIDFSSKVINKAVAIKTDLTSSVAAELKQDSIIQIALISKNQDGSAVVVYPQHLERIRVLKITLDSGKAINEDKEEEKTALSEQKRPATLVLDLSDEQIKTILPYVYAGNVHCFLLNETVSEEYRNSIGLQ